MNMKMNVLKKLKGYQKANRDRFLLLYFNLLTFEEFVVYEFGIAMTDWDESHLETYGTFKVTNREIAEILGWKSDSQASRVKKSLLEKGYFTKIGDRITAWGFEKWQLRKVPNANKQNSSAKLQYNPANMQENHVQTPDYSLVSSNVNLSFPESSEDVSPDDIPF
jgi:hypothetical protein